MVKMYFYPSSDISERACLTERLNTRAGQDQRPAPVVLAWWPLDGRRGSATAAPQVAHHCVCPPGVRAEAVVARASCACCHPLPTMMAHNEFSSFRIQMRVRAHQMRVHVRARTHTCTYTVSARGGVEFTGRRATGTWKARAGAINAEASTSESAGPETCHRRATAARRGARRASGQFLVWTAANQKASRRMGPATRAGQDTEPCRMMPRAPCAEEKPKSSREG
jgi:hypothetical protein